MNGVGWDKFKVFIVDDMSVNIKMILKCLEDFGEHQQVQTFCYTDSELALAEAFQIIPDIFLLDIEMPKLNGIEFCKKIKATPEFNETPVVFITSLDNQQAMQAAFEAGATDFINKPFNNYEVFLRVKSVLTQYNLILEQKKQARIMQEQAEDNRALVKILSHDLANSLVVVSAIANKIKNERLIKTVENMSDLIFHVKEMLALDSGKQAVKLAQVSFLPLVQESYNLLQDRFRQKNIKLKLKNLTNSKEILVRAERTSLLNQVLVNLLTNAIKFSFEGSTITITISQFSRFILVQIKDTGIGIPSDILPNLFSKYVKTTRLGTNKEKGTGFGMPLVKQYMNSYGGEIKIESIEKTSSCEQHGTTVTLFFLKQTTTV